MSELIRALLNGIFCHGVKQFNRIYFMSLASLFNASQRLLHLYLWYFLLEAVLKELFRQPWINTAVTNLSLLFNNTES